MRRAIFKLTQSNLELHFSLRFLLIFLALQISYLSCQHGLLEHWVIDIFTVIPNTALINYLDPSMHAIARGHQIFSPRGSISVLNGCEGTETVFLLMAAILGFKANWRHKVWGMLLGILMVYSFNQVRISTLFFAAQHDRSQFDMLHGYIAPSVMIVTSILFFIRWATMANKNESKPSH